MVCHKQKKISFFKRNATLNIGLIIIAFVFIFAIFPGIIAPYSPIELNIDAILLPPSWNHLFGTDNFGRDIFSRVVWGTRVDLEIGILCTIVPFIIGSLVGLLGGYYGGWKDSVLMRIVDIIMAFPYLILVIAIIAILGPSIINLYIAIWLVGWKQYARLIRSEVMVVRDAEYIQATRVLGYNDLRILLRHIFPNVFDVVIVYAASDVVMCMLAGASLGFLGLGVQPPTPEWGTIIADGRGYLSSAWWICTFPGVALVITGIGFSFFGDGLSDLFRTKGR